MSKKISQLELLETLSGREEFPVSFDSGNYRVKISSFAYYFTKEKLGLGRVDNTTDAEKPISTKQQEALDTKASSESVQLLRQDIASVFYGLDNKAEQNHTHQLNEVDGLQDRLETIDVSLSSILNTVLPSYSQSLTALESRVNNFTIPTSFAISAVTGLAQALSEKAAGIHQHAVTQILGLDDHIRNMIPSKATAEVIVSEW